MKKLFALLLALAVLFPMLPCKALANGLLDKKVRQGINEIDTAIASSESQALQCTAEPEPGPDVRAIEGTYENLKYSIENDEVTITGYVNEPTGALTIPETIEGYPVTGIGDYAFYGVPLTSVKMPNVQTIGNSAFDDCDSLTSAKMSNVETIGDYAFYKCTSLTSVEMSNVKTIGDYAFFGCTSLTSVEMPNVETMHEPPFGCCTNLTSFIISSDNVNYSADGGILYNKDKTVLCAYPSATGAIKIAYSVQTIGQDAFLDCDSLTSVEMPNVQTIGDWAFDGSESLISVEMPNVQTIGDYAFDDCYSITSVEMPNVETIGESAFEGTPLTSVEMPNVKTIGDYAFYYCDSLTSAEMPNVKTIGDDAFSRTALTSVEMPNVQTIGNCAFEYCKVLTSAYFYSGAPTSFGTSVFYGCASGFTIYYAKGTSGWTTPTWNGYPTQEITREFIFEDIEGVDNDAVVINNKGTAYMYYTLISASENEPIRHTSVQYRCGDVKRETVSDNNGTVCLQSDVLSRADDGKDAKVRFEILKVGDSDVSNLFLNEKVKITDYSFSQSWDLTTNFGADFGLTAGASAGIDGLGQLEATIGKVTAGVSGGNVLSMTHTYDDNKRILEIGIDGNIKLSGKVGAGIGAKLAALGIDVISTGAGIYAQSIGNIKLIFDDFDPSNNEHLRTAARLVLTILSIMFPNNAILQSLAAHFPIDEGGSSLEIGTGVKVGGTINNSIGKVSIKFSGDEDSQDAADFAIFDQDIDSYMEYRRGMDSSGGLNRSYKRVTGSTINIVGGNTGTIEMNGHLGEFVKSKSKELRSKITADGKKDLTIKFLTSMSQDTFGISQTTECGYTSYTYNDAVVTRILANGSEKLNKWYDFSKCCLFNNGDYVELCNTLFVQGVSGKYENTIDSTELTSFNLGVDLALGVQVGIDAKLGGSSTYTTTTDTGAIVGGIEFIQSETASNASIDSENPAVNPSDLSNEILSSVASEVKEIFESAVNKISDGVKNAMAHLHSAVDKVKNWTGSILSPNTRSSVTGMALVASTRSGDENTVFAIGSPYTITIEDENNTEIETFEDTPLTLDISFTEAMLADIGYSTETVDLNKIKIYLYDENTDTYKYVGGTLDADTLTVSADITCGGQYILALDTDAPTISMFTVVNGTSKPEFTAYLSDIGGIDVDSIVVALDDQVIIDSANIDEHYSEIGVIHYVCEEALIGGDHTVTFTVADSTGNSQTQSYTLTVDDEAPIIKDFNVSGTNLDDMTVTANVDADDISGVYAAYSIKDGDEWTDALLENMDLADGTYTCIIPATNAPTRVYVAVYDKAGNLEKTEMSYIDYYTVTYLDGITGEVISTTTVEHGADAVFPTPPEHEGYTFTGWDSDGTNITADTTITALYEESVTVLQGDANGDGVINGKDVTLIRRYITGGYDVEVILEAADINGDGVINGKDITLLRRLIVGGYGDVA